MLTPDDRRLFLEALKPPDGYRFDRGLGTTFTLNLITLLITPLSLSMFDQDNIDEMLRDPLILLEGLKRHANRLSIFCQSGYISIPQKENKLYSYLEDMIVQVHSPNGGVFHPKIWLLRYISDDAPVFYRLLSLSRNLTFDRSWDLMVQLDGEVPNRVYGYSRNRPLGKFVEALPELSTYAVSQRILDDIRLMADEVRKADFKQPQGFEDFPEFYPSGIPGYRGYQFSKPNSRVMILSPFLTNDVIHKTISNAQNNVLISSTDQVDQLSSQARACFVKIFTFDEVTDAMPGNEFSTTDGDLDAEGETNARFGGLSGLHAKLFVMESGWDATWLLGSANATRPAFKNKNVEFMIGLKGKKSKVGIDKILNEDEKDFSLLALLQKYQLLDHAPESDHDERLAEQAANDVRNWLVNGIQELRIHERDEAYDMALHFYEDRHPPDLNFGVTCWPISLTSDYEQGIELRAFGSPVIFEGHDLMAITPFIAFSVCVRVGEATHNLKFVIKVPVKNMPPHRDNFIIRAIINNKDQFLRYLRLLLSSEEPSIITEEWFINKGNSTGKNQGWEALDLPLLEDLVRAFSRSPKEKLDRIDEIMREIKATQEADEIIPPEFDYLWDIILDAREALDDR